MNHSRRIQKKIAPLQDHFLTKMDLLRRQSRPEASLRAGPPKGVFQTGLRGHLQVTRHQLRPTIQEARLQDSLGRRQPRGSQ